MRHPLILALLGLLTLLPLTAAAESPYMTRAQMLALTLDVKDDTRQLVDHYRSHRSAMPLFADLDQSSPESPYVEAAFRKGFIRGYDDRTIRLQEAVSIEEASATLLLASGVRLPGSSTDSWNMAVFKEAIRRGMYADVSQVVPGQPVTIAQFTDMERRAGLLDPVHLQQDSAPVAAAEFVQEVVPQAVQEQPAPEPVAAPAPQNVALSDGYQTVAAQPVTDAGSLAAYRSQNDFAITIPSLGIHDLVISHPSDPSTSEGVLSVLQYGVGHLFAYPGRGGKIMVYGHSSSYPWDISPYTKIFRQVNKLKTGDDVYVTYQGQLYHYTVTDQQQIAPTDNSPFVGSGEELLLYTCWPPDSTKSRLVIHAAPVQTVAVR